MDRQREDVEKVARVGGREMPRRASSSSSSDKKPAATLSVVNQQAQNPFAATTLKERDENFPSFERAIEVADSDEENHWANSSMVSSAAAMSISARAALNEHNRHVAQYGLDGDDSMVQQQLREEKATTGTVNPLDAEWERLLLDKSSVNVSSISINQSRCDTDSADVSLGMRFDKVVASQDAIEVLTDLSVSDYFNSSKVLLLRTPEHARYRQQQVTTRGGGGHFSDSHNTTSSEASSSLDASAANLRNMLRLAGLPVPRSSDFDEQRQESEHIFPDAPAGDTSFGGGLTNVDLSRISADGSQNIIELSLNNNNNNNNNGSILLNQSINSSSGDHLITIDEILPSENDRNNESSSISGRSTNKKTKDKVKQHLPYMGSGGGGSQYSSPVRIRRMNHHHSRSNDTSSSSSNSRRRHASPPFRGSLSNSWTFSPQRRRCPPLTLNNRGGSPTSSSFAGKDGTPSRSPTREGFDALGLSPISKNRQPKANSTNMTTDNRIGAGLSPISKRAADIAGQLIQSNEDWKDATRIKNRGPFLHRNPFEEAAENEQPRQPKVDSFHGEHEDDKLSSVIVEYDSVRQQQDDGDISPLHSSSSDKKKHSNDSSSQTGDLKKSSLSSITPNTSSEHHVSTKPNDSSSFSRSSKQNQHQQQFSSPKSIMQTSESGDKKNNKIPSPSSVSRSSNITCCSGLSFGAGDRRRYRTVVPTRVFMTEPSEFPFVQDSFSAPLTTPGRIEGTAGCYGDSFSSAIVRHHHSA